MELKIKKLDIELKIVVTSKKCYLCSNLSIHLRIIQSSRTDHRTLLNKWTALAVHSQVGQLRVGEGQLLILKTGALSSNHKNPYLEWDSNSAPFEILRRVALWRAHYCLSLASMVMI
ncbi:hypothetical protein Pint_17030 [Pistacia integerrima]|uniref:Uncharacterized protein n=1 Tax=Pistacia integerrima TaxID=434235 RepID=A0ACC0ZE34_9ROSI|nr:hypothetical protein Pint_17030 [Pistacia integerrima]